MALTPLMEEYEGRKSSRGRCPFDMQDTTNIYYEKIQPLETTELPEVWKGRLQEAFTEARRLQEWEENQT